MIRYSILVLNKYCLLPTKLTQNAKRTLSNTIQGRPDLVLPATDHRTWDPEGTVKLRIAKSGPVSGRPITVPTMLKGIVEDLPNKVKSFS